jgi:hypothetical protein
MPQARDASTLGVYRAARGPVCPRRARMYALYDLGLGDHRMDDSGTTRTPCPRPTAVAPSRALVAAPRLTMTSSGDLGTSDGREASGAFA